MDNYDKNQDQFTEEPAEDREKDAEMSTAEEDREPAKEINTAEEDGDGSSGKEEKQSIGRTVWEYLRLVIIVVAALIVVQNFVIVNAQIPTQSMQETIMVGDRIFGNRLAYVFGEPKRYDIVIFKYPDNESQLYIKRIIGLPGETVTVREDGVYIDSDDTPLAEDFCPEKPDYIATLYRLASKPADLLADKGISVLFDSEGKPLAVNYRVPEGKYFMMGDNRNNSKDSRYWDNPYVERGKILGAALLRYWPLNKICIISGADSSWHDPVNGG